MRTYCSTIDELLTQLAETDGGSDLILAVGKPPVIKIHRVLQSLSDYPPLVSTDTEELCLPLLNKAQRAQFHEKKEIDLAYDLAGLGRFRINLFRQRGHIGLVARVVMDQVPDFDTLGLPTVIREMANLKQGLVLFTGPAGQGKSTSVAAMIDYINRHRACHIVTIEDPIEYIHHHAQSIIEQREVGIDTESFHAALCRVLRQAPDVILIGEIRDGASAQAAMTLAETGHLILATLHTSGAINSVNRLLDMFPAEQESQMRTQLATSLAAVVWQQLLPARDRDGLVLACEVLIAVPAVRSLIRHGRIHEVGNLIQTGRKFGMFNMDQSIQALMKEGRVDPAWFDSNHFDMAKQGQGK